MVVILLCGYECILADGVKVFEKEGTFFFLFYYFILFLFLELYLWHMEVPRLGIESELQLPAYTTATAMQNLSHICGLHHSSQQRQIMDPLSKARDRTHILGYAS